MVLRKTDFNEAKRELARCFRLWDIDLWSVVKEADRSRRATVQFFRNNQVQIVSCESEWSKGANLRRVFLLLDSLRKAEQAGVAYSGLASTTDLVSLGVEESRTITLEDDYTNLGLTRGATVEEIKRAWRKWAMAFHPDRFPESQREWAEEQFEEKKASYERICEARSISP